MGERRRSSFERRRRSENLKRGVAITLAVGILAGGVGYLSQYDVNLNRAANSHLSAETANCGRATYVIDNPSLVYPDTHSRVPQTGILVQSTEEGGNPFMLTVMPKETNYPILQEGDGFVIVDNSVAKNPVTIDGKVVEGRINSQDSSFIRYDLPLDHASESWAVKMAETTPQTGETLWVTYFDANNLRYMVPVTMVGQVGNDSHEFMVAGNPIEERNRGAVSEMDALTRNVTGGVICNEQGEIVGLVNQGERLSLHAIEGKTGIDVSESLLDSGLLQESALAMTFRPINQVLMTDDAWQS
ncbi:MAG TPA: hypothetical protein VLF20_00305 [Patescibacteria group bacterium]|nr:hypothetical protein [Patescibacteria group bacterium]